MSHTHTSLNYHIVFGTKGRAQSIGPDMRDNVSRYLGGIIKSENGLPLEIGAVADHVHLLVRLPPTVALADLLRTLKANSSKWLNDTVPAPNVCVAGRIRRVHRQSVATRPRGSLRAQSGRASSENDVSRGARGALRA